MNNWITVWKVNKMNSLSMFSKLINPEKNTIVAVASYFKPTVFDRVDFIEDTLLPQLQ